MFVQSFKSKLFILTKAVRLYQKAKYYSIFGIKDIISQEKVENFRILPITNEQQNQAVDLIKQHYLTEHVLVKARNMDVFNDQALDEYLLNLLKQGNSVYAKSEDGSVSGVCISFASSPVDPKNLRSYAFYRQDPNIKDFLYFTAKLQETPNLWEVFKQQKVFEIKMLAVLPEYRRQGLGVMLTEKCKTQAQDQGYNVIQMDCINPYDYKIAEHCMMQCIVKFPLHKLRGANAPYIKRSSEFNRYVRVYVDARAQPDSDWASIKSKKSNLEILID